MVISLIHTFEIVDEMCFSFQDRRDIYHGNNKHARKSVSGDREQFGDWEGNGQRTGQDGRDGGDALPQSRER
ncbi:hypothetical protein KSD_60020 [Ktedonobacter sp. SOSP1-85]|nr:hypothetical protein KSD_60020 [Ktedonobacter sp. SOSP1-85]